MIPAFGIVILPQNPSTENGHVTGCSCILSVVQVPMNVLRENLEATDGISSFQISCFGQKMGGGGGVLRGGVEGWARHTPVVRAASTRGGTCKPSAFARKALNNKE